MVQHRLTTMGMEVDAYFDGQSGLEDIVKDPPDLAIIDVMMPGMNGLEVTRALRVNRATANLPIVIFSALVRPQDQDKGLEAGADHYVIKPFMMPELIARVHVLVRRSAGHAAPRWQLGELEIDTVSQSVMRNGELIGLTGREYAILRELAAASGRVVRREQLCLRVWPDEAVPSAGALEFQIHALRRKLGTGAIRTIRGVGYMLSAQ